jgi:hypothetical protein
MANKDDHYDLEIPLDASVVEGFKPEQALKVAVVDVRGNITSQTVKLSDKGTGTARFALPQRSTLEVLVGPETASDDELVKLQTIKVQVSAKQWKDTKLRLSPVIISSFYWYWWLRWCRTFTIQGRVVCADGSPVPGASVCAYDVDWWWWWSSSQQVGCAVTDASGAFTLQFRWCCGWWPWWWWRLRHWQLEPKLSEHIHEVLQRDPAFPRPPQPSPEPSLGVFEQLLSQGGKPTRPPSSEVDLAALPSLREQLVTRLPGSLELERLRVWPWWPWEPWWDCNPDIIFKVTQDCGETKVIVNEQFSDARWNIPTALSVTLVANDQACCIKEPPPPEGNCLVLASVCNDLINTIGGNFGAPATPEGFLNPGAVAVYGDRPYAGAISIEGLFGTTANVDYYEFEYTTTPANAASWQPLPAVSAGGFTRVYWSGGFVPASFPFTIIDGRNVIESREHWESLNGPQLWVQNRDLLMVWLTENNFADKTYYLRLIGYDEANSKLTNPRILPVCDTEKDNGLVITLDNRTSSLEPEADIVDVRINGASAGPCSNVDARQGGVLDVDFVAYDEDDHLAYYSLIATYGKNLAVDLLLVAGATLTPLALGTIPAALQVGPDYGQASGQGAPSPAWAGGGLQLHIPDLHKAFPETCCYQLELRVYKRTVANCDHNYSHNKLSYYSLTVVV